ncbi:MAG TPA: tyrosine-type recombinase/integrase, partial [Jatrophihabitantaceae bacterium]
RNRVLVERRIVEGSLKNDEARRVEIHPRTAATLRRWRAATAAERLAAGEAYVSGEHVFVDELGEALSPDAVSHRFGRLVARVDVPSLTIHGTRHTSGTVLVSAGVPVHVVAARLGHDPAVLLKTYAHVLPGSDRDAAERVGQAIYGTAGGPIE